MKIVHVCVTEAFAGTERYIAEVSAEQTRLGHDVAVIGGPPLRDACPTGLVASGGSIRAALASLRALRADVVHAHLTFAELAAVLSKGRTGARCIATRHIAAPRGSSARGRLLRPVVQVGLDEEIAISSFVAERVGRRCVVLRNGVRTQDDRSESVTTTILVAQRLEPEKSTELALTAWFISPLPSRGWTLEIAGDGSQRSVLEDLVAQHPLGSSVRFLGHVNDVGIRLRSAAALLAPAPAEPLGLSVLEAMAHGTPVIAAAGGGHRETLPPDYPYLFAPGDAAGAAARLVEVGLDPVNWTKTSEALQARQRAEFTVEGHVAQLMNIYESVCAR